MTTENVQSAEGKTPDKPRISTSGKIILAASALNLVSLSINATEFYNSFNSATTQEDASASQEQSLAARLAETKVIKIEHTYGDNYPERYNDGHIQYHVGTAGMILENLSKGTLTLPDEVAVNTIKLTPEGLHTDEKSMQSTECYSDAQINRVQTQFLQNNKLPEQTNLMTVINQGESCTMLEHNAAGIAADANGRWLGTMYTSAFDTSIILHELGHTPFELGHATIANCKAPAVTTLLEESKTDIAELIGYGCKVPQVYDRKQDKEVMNAYADLMTVMGGMDINRRGGRIAEYFNAIETTKIVPDIAINKAVEPERAHYTLSADYEALRAISFTIEGDHPLRTGLDVNIDTLSIGVVSDLVGGEPTLSLQVIAHHKDQSYRLQHAFPYHLSVDASLGPVEMYHDETLGIKIIASPNEDGKCIDIAIEPVE